MPKRIKQDSSRWNISDLDIPRIRGQRERAIQFGVSALLSEEVKHKHYYIEQMLKTLNVNIEELKDQLEDIDYFYEESEQPS